MPKPERQPLGELLSAYLDGELGASERVQVERALREREEARRVLEDLRHAVSAVKLLPRHSASPTIFEELRLHMERSELLEDTAAFRSAGSHRVPLRTRLFGLAAMLALVAAGGWWLFGDRLSSVPASRSYSPTAFLDASTMSRHAFSKESVRIQVTLGDETSRKAFLNQLTKKMANAGFADFGGTGRSDSKTRSAGDMEFFVLGKPGINFADASQQQVLIRASTDAMASLLDELRTEAPGPEKVSFLAEAGEKSDLGKLRKQVVTWNTSSKEKPGVRTAKPSTTSESATAETPPRPESFRLAEGLIEALGLERAMRSSDESSEGSGASRDADAKETTPSAETSSDSPSILKDRPSLVKRRMGELEQGTQSPAERQMVTLVIELHVKDQGSKPPGSSSPSVGGSKRKG